MTAEVSYSVSLGFEGIIVVTSEPAGTGTVRMLSDDARPDQLLRTLTAVQMAVLAARLRTWAGHLDGDPGRNVPPGAMRCRYPTCPDWIDAGEPVLTASAMRDHERTMHP